MTITTTYTRNLTDPCLIESVVALRGERVNVRGVVLCSESVQKIVG